MLLTGAAKQSDQSTIEIQRIGKNAEKLADYRP
jgi:hypothetical protein